MFVYVLSISCFVIQSSVESMLSVSAENVDCYESGVICRKALLITIGRSVIAFDDDSGKPVSTLAFFKRIVRHLHLICV